MDLRRAPAAHQATQNIDYVFALAADMGGIGYISSNNAAIVHGNAVIDLNTIDAARRNGVARYLYTSSACVYPRYRQNDTNATALREEDAYPADPQDGYGWEKLFSEQLCSHFRTDYGLDTRIARLHNVFGPEGVWRGGREKAPAGICRKVAIAKFTGGKQIEIWDDGEQTRSFCFISDCVACLIKLLSCSYPDPVNIGQDRLVSINRLVDEICTIAGVSLRKVHVPDPIGVRGRNSDNDRARRILSFAPSVSLEEGLEKTYTWVEEQVRTSIQECNPEL
jgi:nucleoside-diphosphate-sugar epimerase